MARSSPSTTEVAVAATDTVTEADATSTEVELFRTAAQLGIAQDMTVILNGVVQT